MGILETFPGYLSCPPKALLSPNLDYFAACMGHGAWPHHSKVQAANLLSKPQYPINKAPQHAPDLCGDIPQTQKIKERHLLCSAL